jgi:hypothetical protein
VGFTGHRQLAPGVAGLTEQCGGSFCGQELQNLLMALGLGVLGGCGAVGVGDARVGSGVKEHPDDVLVCCGPRTLKLGNGESIDLTDTELITVG